MKSSSQGLVFSAAAFILWGLFPMYFKQIHNMGAIETTAYRIVTSSLYLTLFFLLFPKKIQSFKPLLTVKNIVIHLFSTLLIGLNWFLFVYATFESKVSGAGFGYFISPLLSMFWGIVFYSESIQKRKLLTLALVISAIVLKSTSLNGFPYIALILALSFSLYGSIKKKISINSLTSITFESYLLTPISLIILYQSKVNHLEFFNNYPKDSLFVLGSGILTIAPLVLFNMAAKRTSLMTLGLFQYLAPTLHILQAFLLYQEKLEASDIWAFSTIWVAIGLHLYFNWRDYERK